MSGFLCCFRVEHVNVRVNVTIDQVLITYLARGFESKLPFNVYYTADENLISQNFMRLALLKNMKTKYIFIKIFWKRISKIISFICEKVLTVSLKSNNYLIFARFSKTMCFTPEKNAKNTDRKYYVDRWCKKKCF